MKMYVGGKWIDKAKTVPVINPFDGSQIDTVPRGDAGDVEAANCQRSSWSGRNSPDAWL